MPIPSYDDLTPSIPDVSPGEVFTSTAALLPDAGPVASRVVAGGVSRGHVFAALHGASSDTLVRIACDFSPRIERQAGGSVVLDVAGLGRLFGGPATIAAELARAGAPHVAVAASQTAAILLARLRPGVTVAAGEPEAALRDVPMALLQQLLAERAAGIAPARARRTAGASASTVNDERPFDVLRRWGLQTLGELAALPASDLSARLGPAGVAIQRLARGIDPRPLVPDPAVPRFAGTFELEWPIDALEPLSFVFARVLEPIVAALERADRGAVAVRLDLRLTNRTCHARMLQLPAAMRDPRVLRTLLLLDLESHPPSAAVDGVSLEVDPAPARIVQYSLLERAVPSPETLATLMARLGALVGERRCGSPVLLDTHRPDGFEMGPVAIQETRRRSNAQLPTPHCPLPIPNSHPPTPNSQSGPSAGRETSAGRWRLGVGGWQLIRTAPALTLRRFRPPLAVRVTVERGRPVRVAIDRRGLPGGGVQQAAGPWRTSGGWWEAERWNRDEWDVALGDGALCRLFRDRDSGSWFLEGTFD